MDMSLLRFDEATRTVEIKTDSNAEMLEAVQYLINEGFVGVNDFHHVYFSNGKYEKVDVVCDYSPKYYKRIIIHSIDFTRTDPDSDNYQDVNAAIMLLKMLNLYLFDSIESVLKDKENYMVHGFYNIQVNANGLFRWETKYGAQFMYD